MMIRIAAHFSRAVLLVLFLASFSFAGTKVKISPAEFSGVTIPVDTTVAETQFEKYLDDFFSKNRMVFPSGLAMLNTLGYPIGKAYIGQFPSFEFGTAAGLGVFQRHRQDEYTDGNPTMPGGGANGGFHIGTGITDDLDIIVKFFSLNWVYRVDETFENQGDSTQFIFYAKDINFYAFGAKLRYNIIDPMPLVPFVLKFGGVTVGCGLDYFRLSANTTMDVSDTRTIAVTGIGDVSATANYTSDIVIAADMVSVTPEIFVYADLFYFISLYTGPSVSFNWGSLIFRMEGDGSIVNTKSETLPGPIVIPANTKLATMTMESEYKMGPYLVIPKWVVGTEFNFWVLKLQAEVAFALTGTNTDIADSITAQVGVRFHFQGDKDPKRSDDDYEERVKKREEKKKQKRGIDPKKKYEFIEDYQ